MRTPASLFARPLGGRPLSQEAEYLEASSLSTDTNPDDEFDVDTQEVCVRQRPSGKASPQNCKVCTVGLKSKSALAGHMKSFHPESRLYCCSICDVAFNCAPDLSSHTSNLHQKKRIKCKHCMYKATSCARMHLHVRIHTGGVRCVKCNKLYPLQ